eukprot:363050-Chlamydomonas_euryale.AAC.1
MDLFVDVRKQERGGGVRKRSASKDGQMGAKDVQRHARRLAAATPLTTAAAIGVGGKSKPAAAIPRFSIRNVNALQGVSIKLGDVKKGGGQERMWWWGWVRPRILP